jgi:hypothetical protein
LIDLTMTHVLSLVAKTMVVVVVFTMCNYQLV